MPVQLHDHGQCGDLPQLMPQYCTPRDTGDCLYSAASRMMILSSPEQCWCTACEWYRAGTAPATSGDAQTFMGCVLVKLPSAPWTSAPAHTDVISVSASNLDRALGLIGKAVTHSLRSYWRTHAATHRKYWL